MGWDYQLLMSVLAVTLVVYHFFEFPKFWRVVLIVNFCVISLTVYDIMGRDLYRSFMASSVLTLCFLLFLGYVGYLRFRRVC
jgi:multisubunit Na+/H+ antiporter MnhF subunit